MVVLVGDAGMGKTRLAAEWGREVHEDGALVLYGRCDEETVGPYQPFVESLRGHAAAAGPLPQLFERLGPRGAELARLLPELGDAAAAELAPPELLRDAEGQRFRLFSAFGALLAELGAQRPLVLVIDDLHWADRPTLQLLRHLARGQQPERFLLLAAYRETELEPDHPLPPLLGDLRRDAGLERLALDGLREDEVAALIAELAGTTPSPQFVDALLGETEGNPFFIEEVLRHLRESGGELPAELALADAGVPEGVHEVTARRLRRLGEEARRAVGTAAVIGREFDYDGARRGDRAPTTTGCWPRSRRRPTPASCARCRGASGVTASRTR